MPPGTTEQDKEHHMNRPFDQTGTYEVKYLYLGGVIETHTVEAHCHDCAVDLAQPERHDLDVSMVLTKEIK